MTSLGRDIKSVTKTKFAQNSHSVISGGSNDAANVNGTSLNLHPAALGFKAESVCFEIPVQATLAGSETGTLNASIQDSADNSAWTDLVASAAVLSLTASVLTGVARVQADLNKARQYVRVITNLNLTGSNTNLATVGCTVALFGGLQEAP